MYAMYYIINDNEQNGSYENSNISYRQRLYYYEKFCEISDETKIFLTIPPHLFVNVDDGN